MSNDFLETLIKPSFKMSDHIQTKQQKASFALSKQEHPVNEKDYFEFERLCSRVKLYLEQKMEDKKNDLKKHQEDDWTTRQKNAMLLVDKDVNFYMEEIKQFLEKENSAHIRQPHWYDSLAEGIFHENWGLGGIYEWVKKGTSSQCKIVPPHIFFHEDGYMRLKPQKLTNDRFNKIKSTLLLNDTSQRKNSKYNELYLTKDIRIEIFNNHKKMSSEGYIVFRRNVVDGITFEKLSALGSFEQALIPALEAMVGCGFNVCMIGPVKSGKTTFLKAYQRLENKILEGVSIETDPEIDFMELMGQSPFMELVADNEELERTMKPLMRSDADYFIFPEARDGRALQLLLKLTKKGTRRVKGAFHTATPEDFPYDVAQEIVDVYGGEIWGYMIQTAINFDFLFEFRADAEDARIKRLVGIHEIQFDRSTFNIRSNSICQYDVIQKKWVYHAKLSKETISRACNENYDAYAKLESTLQQLERVSPNPEPYRISPFSRLIPIQGR